jgi:hypothetical protein
MGSNAECIGDFKSHCWSNDLILDSEFKQCLPLLGIRRQALATGVPGHISTLRSDISCLCPVSVFTAGPKRGTFNGDVLSGIAVGGVMTATLSLNNGLGHKGAQLGLDGESMSADLGAL